MCVSVFASSVLKLQHMQSVKLSLAKQIIKSWGWDKKKMVCVYEASVCCVCVCLCVLSVGGHPSHREQQQETAKGPKRAFESCCRVVRGDLGRQGGSRPDVRAIERK